MRRFTLLYLIIILVLTGCGTQCQNGHDWINATCTTPKTCLRCGKTVGEPLGHHWVPATMTLPKTCDRCGETEGKPIECNSNHPSQHNDDVKQEHKCIVCEKRATEVYTNPFSGETEYYCQQHYDELIDTVDSILEAESSSDINQGSSTYDAYLDYGGSNVFIANSKSELELFTTYVLNDDLDAIDSMVLNGQIAVVESGIKVNILEIHSSVVKILILEGLFQGVECWTIVEAVNMV